MNRVLLIGWDAADWKVIRPLLEAGQMPNLARLMAEGVHGNLATIYPALSPMLWTSIATGKRAYKHGIHGFTEPFLKAFFLCLQSIMICKNDKVEIGFACITGYFFNGP